MEQFVAGMKDMMSWLNDTEALVAQTISPADKVQMEAMLATIKVISDFLMSQQFGKFYYEITEPYIRKAFYGVACRSKFEKISVSSVDHRQVAKTMYR